MDLPTPTQFPIRKAYPHVFPKVFQTFTTKEDLRTSAKLYRNPDLSFAGFTLEYYYADFPSNPGKYDLHEIGFQDFALSVLRQIGTTSKNLRQLSSDPNHANKRLIRAATYAVSARYDVGWDFQPITDLTAQTIKQSELEEFALSAVLYDWDQCESFEAEIPTDRERFKTVSFAVPITDTQTAIENVSRHFPRSRIAWLNMANGHSTLGSYNCSHGGSQEEEVVTNTTVAVALGLHADVTDTDFKTWWSGENHLVYKQGRHIPPEGNYFVKTRFLTSTRWPESDLIPKCEQIIDCYMIAAAFADFRMYVPGMTSWSEAPYYYTWGGYVEDQAALEQRLTADIVGVIKTAVVNDITVLVLGASGCGAFRHDPWLEAKLWKRALDTYGYYFEHVEFAILPDEKNPDNTTAFVEVILDR